MKNLWSQLLGGKRDLALVLCMIGILVILFTPIPPALLDFLLIINLSVGLLLLLLTFYTDKPLSFSTFPSLLLMATLFRVSLNVTATRLILNGGYAGKVIGAIGSYVVGGNYVVGLVVFLILVVIQYVVVTNGAQRVAEVAARFTLDSMPGKQMSIDADMNMGLIDEKEARRRRALIEREASFYGAMDGATKFVKGDAVAGIIIILINIIGGLSVGVVQRGMSWADALHTYTLLTVGDGIVTQIPSLVIATATGIIITRAASDAQLGEEVSKQILSHPGTLLIVAVTLFAALFMPSLPILPVLVVLGLFGLAAFWASRKRSAETIASAEQEAATDDKQPEDFYQLMRLDPVEIRLGRDLAAALLAGETTLVERLQAFRRQFAVDFGFVIPTVRVRQDVKLQPTQYLFDLYGTRVAAGELKPDQTLAINPGGKRAALDGEETREPTYGLAARWISAEQRQFARSAGYTLVDPETVLITHFSEVIKRHSADLLTRAETERLTEHLKQHNTSLVEELVPTVLSYSDIQKVLQQLLREKVSIRNLEAIMEVLIDQGKTTKIPEELTERVRERLGGSICQSMANGQGEVHVLTLAPELEQSLLGAIRTVQKGQTVPLITDPRRFDQFLSALAQQCEAMMAKSLLPVLLCPGALRRHLRLTIGHALPHVMVVGLNEIPTTAKIRSFGTVALAER